MITYKDLISSKLVPESGVPNGKKNDAISCRISTRGQETFTLYKKWHVQLHGRIE